jgi:drug/metabolite transporter (DMT)-like permease
MSRHTLLGLLSILFWSTTVGFSRSLTEVLGTFTTGAAIYLLAGGLGCAWSIWRGRSMRGLFKAPRPYLIWCGLLFVTYLCSLYLAIGASTNRAQVLAVGLINYLWPGLSLAFSVPILKKRARPYLPAGVLIGLAGIWLAVSNGGQADWQSLLSIQSLLPLSLALVAAITWALYTNLSRYFGGEGEHGSVPLFLLASGLLLGAFRLIHPEDSIWSWSAGLRIFFMALFPGWLAYSFWDHAVRRGNLILVATLSYLTPLFSTLISVLVLDVKTGPSLWLAALLVIVGAWISNTAIEEQAPSKAGAA